MAGQSNATDSGMVCEICKSPMSSIFQSTVLHKYEVQYFRCPLCDYVTTEAPYWIEEAYASSINVYDTGILLRNENLSKLASVLLYFCYDRKGRFVDWAGGYGIFTRLMRDAGFDFYWEDKYTQNLLARGFEYSRRDGEEIELVTALEVFEHFVHPVEELDGILKISRNLLFTTELLPCEIRPDWWYFAFEHGQHTSFYSLRTLQQLANRNGLFLYSNGHNVHLFSERKLSSFIVLGLFRLNRFGLDAYVRKRMSSRCVSDHEMLRKTFK